MHRDLGTVSSSVLLVTLMADQVAPDSGNRKILRSAPAWTLTQPRSLWGFVS